jgi:dipeptidyl aminopeptidase/acylaminoacyl peptidase
VRTRIRLGTGVVVAALVLALSLWAAVPLPAQGVAFTLPQVLGYPFPGELVASPTRPQIAWVLTERGVRNIWIAEGPGYEPRRLTDYREDDGQELTNLGLSADGRHLVYVRGGDHGANWPADGNLMPNPASSPIQPEMQVWAIPTAGGSPRLLGAGDEPAISPQSERVVFLRDRQIWVAPIDGSKPAARLFFTRGSNGSPVWSPDGRTVAFVSDRDDHSFIGLYTSDDQPIRYLAPSTSRDSSPRWSPDGKRVAFVRQAGRGGPQQSLLDQHPAPWAIWTADASSGEGRVVWRSPETLLGSFPRTQGGANLNWAAGDRLVFLADLDQWPHLYSVPLEGGNPLLLTPGEFMVEYLVMTPDRRSVVYNANAGPDRDDIDRRHVYRVPVDAARPAALTSGRGIEWTPVVSGDGGTAAYISAGAQAPPLPAVVPLAGDGPARVLGADRVPADFPRAQLVTPESVVVQAADGTPVRCQLFLPREGKARKPAVIFVHGGPPRQMLLGWHYMVYYANAYAVNQYLASRGFVVLSVNYRLGIGYGFALHHPDHAGTRGAAEYQDVLAAGRYLQGRSDVDPEQIGIWGGSYGGYLTALALGRNSEVFAAGVDIHGVHDWSARMNVAELATSAALADGITEADVKEALRVAWDSSPVASVSTWRSPVLFIHGDDDRNVQVHQTVDLVRRLAGTRVAFEETVIPDEIHDFLLYKTWLKVDAATAAYFERVFRK